MRHLFERLREDLNGFITQRDAVMMEVSCTDEDAPLVFKVLSDLDLANEADLFLLSIDSFTSPATYVDAVVLTVRTQLISANEQLLAEGLPTLSSLPTAVDDTQISPDVRLRFLFEHARAWLPVSSGHRVIWALFPMQVADPGAFSGLLRALLPSAGIASWMRNSRLFVRGRTDGQTDTLGRYARRMFVDFSPAVLEASLVEEAQNSTVSEAQRAQALLSLAQLDSAHGRIASARTRFITVVEYAKTSQNNALLTLAYNGLGELAHRGGELADARSWYECAIMPACETRAPVLLAMLSRNLGDLSFLQHRYRDAEQHYDEWQRLAGEMLDAEGRVQALQKRALSQLRQDRQGEARVTLETAATLGRNLEMWGLHRFTLAELGQLYGQAGERELSRQVAAELQTLPAMESAHG